MSNVTLTATLEAYKLRKEFHFSDNLSKFYGFFDWFCSDAALEKRGKALMGKLVKFVETMKAHGEFDTDKYYVIFKNNCPIQGNLYDDFRLCDFNEGGVLMGMAPKLGYSSPEAHGKANIWCYEAGKDFEARKGGQRAGARDYNFDTPKEAMDAFAEFYFAK